MVSSFYVFSLFSISQRGTSIDDRLERRRKDNIREAIRAREFSEDGR
ncbi:MAG: hypothetical protein ACOC53_08065 [Candidatus Saliniplasma sp.]